MSEVISKLGVIPDEPATVLTMNVTKIESGFVLRRGPTLRLKLEWMSRGAFSSSSLQMARHIRNAENIEIGSGRQTFLRAIQRQRNH
jgi:hypothetical protein